MNYWRGQTLERAGALSVGWRSDSMVRPRLGTCLVDASSSFLVTWWSRVGQFWVKVTSIIYGLIRWSYDCTGVGRHTRQGTPGLIPCEYQGWSIGYFKVIGSFCWPEHLFHIIQLNCYFKMSLCSNSIGWCPRYQRCRVAKVWMGRRGVLQADVNQSLSALNAAYRASVGWSDWYFWMALAPTLTSVGGREGQYGAWDGVGPEAYPRKTETSEGGLGLPQLIQSLGIFQQDHWRLHVCTFM